MPIDVQTAKTLIDRINGYLRVDKRDPTFVFNGLFAGIQADGHTTMSDVGNFLYQISFDGSHLYDFIKNAAAGIDVFAPFALNCTRMRLFLTPCAIRESAPMGSVQGEEVFNINFIEHTYDERIDRVLHKMEDPIDHSPPPKTEREQIAEKTEEIVKKYLNSSKLKYRFELMQLDLRTSKKSVWLSREVSLPVRIVRNASRIRSAIRIFFTDKPKMIEFVQSQSQKKVAQYQSKRRDEERNQKRAQWKADHHDAVLAQCNAVREWLHAQGYVRVPVEYWH